jgi:hypothetical protein
MRRTLTAINTAPDSENRMHGDAAQQYGFRGGLVPGVDVLGYLAHEAVASWGASWLSGGRLDGRLLLPVYDGEQVEVTLEASEERTDALLAQVVGGDDRLVRARALLSLLGTTAGTPLSTCDPKAFRLVEPPPVEARPPASRALLEVGTHLATQRIAYDAARAPHYLDEISETHPAFRDEGFAHPGWLLRFANWALARSVRLGPWIHVSSDAWFGQPVRDGDELEVRAVVTGRYDKKGHEFVELRVLYLVQGAPVALVDHCAIWQPRPRTT